MRFETAFQLVFWSTFLSAFVSFLVLIDQPHKKFESDRVISNFTIKYVHYKFNSDLNVFNADFISGDFGNYTNVITKREILCRDQTCGIGESFLVVTNGANVNPKFRTGWRVFGVFMCSLFGFLVSMLLTMTG
jgi:hypothetical protein